VEPTTEKTEKKEKPKKKSRKPTYSVRRYKSNPVSGVINKGVTDALNSTVLEHHQQLKKGDSQIGEATMFMVEYYTALDINHPALVMFSAVMGLTMTVMELRKKPAPEVKEAKTRRPRRPKKITENLVDPEETRK